MLSCFKKLDITGLTQSDFISTFDRVTNFTIDNTNVDKYNDLFGKDYPKLNISLFTASFPVVEELNLKNVPLPDILDLSKCTKLKTLNLSNSTVKRVILPANV
nr:MAG TPA: Toll-like receptor 2, Variable lymphocyte, TLR1, Pam3CSK4, lipopeptide, innate [Bacteriophage sp.]